VELAQLLEEEELFTFFLLTEFSLELMIITTGVR
jgi:hypothetical protein